MILQLKKLILILGLFTGTAYASQEPLSIKWVLREVKKVLTLNMPMPYDHSEVDLLEHGDLLDPQDILERDLEEKVDRVRNEKNGSPFAIFEDEFAASVALEYLFQTAYDESDFSEVENLDEFSQIYFNSLVNTLSKLKESGVYRTSVHRKMMIALCNQCNPKFNTLTKEAKNQFSQNMLEQILEDDLEYENCFECRVIYTHKKIKNIFFKVMTMIQTNAPALAVMFPRTSTFLYELVGYYFLHENLIWLSVLSIEGHSLANIGNVYRIFFLGADPEVTLGMAYRLFSLTVTGTWFFNTTLRGFIANLNALYSSKCGATVGICMGMYCHLIYQLHLRK